MNEEAIIRKLNEISQWLKAISDNSKPIHQLPTIEGNELWTAASNGSTTGKKKIEDFQMPDLALPYKWHNTSLQLGTPINISNEKLNFNLVPDSTNILNGFVGENIPDGIIGNIRNGSDSPIVVKHNVVNSPYVHIPIFLSSQNDLYLHPNDTLSFKYSHERNQVEIQLISDIWLTSMFDESFVFDSSTNPTQQFTLSFIPTQIESIFDTNTPIWMDDNDFTVVGNVLTINYTLEENAIIKLKYFHLI